MSSDTAVRQVHLVFKTHLDVGFTDFARSVVDNYFQCYIPQALTLAETLRASNGPKADGPYVRFIWTTGSWLIYEYLEQAGPAERRRMEDAIAAGDIAWHALPCTFHSELLDPELYRFGLSLSAELDKRFGKHTIAAKMTDVPGHTRSIVPLLAEAGVRFLHIGVNAACTPPEVPPVFVWRDTGGAEIIVMYQSGYGNLAVVPGLDEALMFAHTNDNMGPQSAAGVRAAYADARARLPGAAPVASTLDAFAARLLTIKDQLPVVTQEIGDTWIHGGATDPRKMAHFRQLLRLRAGWLSDIRLSPLSAEAKAFQRKLLLVPEHTWGLDVKTHLADFTHWATPDFAAVRGQANFQKLEASWAEQRDYLNAAVDALPAELALEAREALATLEPARPDLTGYEQVSLPDATFETVHFTAAFDTHGGLCRLTNRADGRAWANAAHTLGQWRYQTFAQADYDRFYKQYAINKQETAEWSVPDLTKPGIGPAGAVAGEWLPNVEAVYRRTDETGDHFILLLALPAACAHGYGGPAAAALDVYFPANRPAIAFELQWFNKPACRLPEALWFSFSPLIEAREGWHMDKLGEPVSPLDVVINGNRKLHAVNMGLSYEDETGGLLIETLDAPLVAPGDRSLLDFNNRQPALSRGVHFLLFDNVWGTNFPMWYDEDARFRFVIRVQS
jgi:hypothetical protein